MFVRRYFWSVLLAIVTSLAISPAARAQFIWTGTDGDLANPANWGGTLPSTGDEVQFNYQGTNPTFDDLSIKYISFYGPATTGNNNQSYTIGGGTITFATLGNVDIYNANADETLSPTTLAFTTNAAVRGTGLSTNTLTLSPVTLTMATGQILSETGPFVIAPTGTGTLGTGLITTDTIANGATSAATISLNGGALSKANGTITANAAAINIGASSFTMQRGVMNAAGSPINITAGAFNVSDTNTTTLNASGAPITVTPTTSFVTAGRSLVVTGGNTVSLNGGLGGAAGNAIFTMGTTGTLNLGSSGSWGGFLQLGASNASFVTDYGNIQISAADALGDPGTFAGGYTDLGPSHSGALIVNNPGSPISIGEYIYVRGRDNAANAAIINAAGNNTFTGTIQADHNGSGSIVTFRSDVGMLGFSGNILQNNSTPYALNLAGAATGIISGTITEAASSWNVVKSDAGNWTLSGNNSYTGITAVTGGTLTLAGAANTNVGDWVVNGGTLAVGASAGFSFAASSPTGSAPRVFIQNGSNLDVSAVSGGFTLTQSLQGTGNVLGSLKMASGTQVIPGGSPTVDLTTGSISGITYGVGSLHFNSGLDMSAGSQMVWHLGALSTTSPGTNFDQMTVDGALKLGGTSSLSVDLSLLTGAQAPGGGDPFWNTSHTWTIANSPINPGNTNFASLVGGTVATGTFSASYSAPVPGDVDHNGVVNGLDIAVIAGNWLHTGAPGIPGDADYNGVVNGLDIGIIAGHWLQSGPLGSIVLTYTPSAGSGLGVPEPSTFLLAALGLVGLVCLRRQRR